MNIIAIDASTKSSGVAVYRHNKLQKYECLTASSPDLFRRIEVMVDKVREVIAQNPDIDYVILEQVRQQEDSIYMSIKTYKALMYLQGCLGMMLHKDFKHIQMDFMYPTSWRKVCGIRQGRGIKRPVQKQFDKQWVKDRYGIQVNDDIADAICLGYAYLEQKK